MFLATDLHLTDRDRDEYRWSFFEWFSPQQGQERLVILGDLTDAKDGHSSRLVNRIIDTLLDLPGPVEVLMGNHDYNEKECPFFRFLGRTEFGEKLRFIHKPTFIGESTRVLALPHTREPLKVWAKLDIGGVNVILTHQTYNGADAGGHKLESKLPNSYWSDRGFKGNVYSGDVHVPQKIGDVTYVGCPYPVHFGDKFQPRILEINTGDRAHHKVTTIKVPSIKRAVLDLAGSTDTKRLEQLQKGDQAKLRVHLPRSEFCRWPDHKQTILNATTALGVEVFSIELQEAKTVRTAGRDVPAHNAERTPEDTLRIFCKRRGIDPSIEETALELITK